MTENQRQLRKMIDLQPVRDGGNTGDILPGDALCTLPKRLSESEQHEDHLEAQENAREKGWNTYGSGWSVPERGEGYD